ncbi:serine/threonine protein kinase [Gammaproteobacteria bacterium LSUCC0112]|nr:serine/threonine protein kinase [Gammaproteobacteria bacterium LSUCC0112]
MHKSKSGNVLEQPVDDALSESADIAARHPYDVLGPDQVLDAAEGLGLQTSARVFALNSYENRVYQIGLEDGSFVIAKFYRPERWSDAQILEEHAFTQELASLEIPVVPPMTVHGKTLHSFLCGTQTFRFSLFPRLAGRPPELDNPDNLQVMGRFLGRVHRVGSQALFKHRIELSIEQWAVKSRAFLIENRFIPAALMPAYESLSLDLIARINKAFSACGQLTHLRLHGDCHPGNVLWRGDQPWFVDFDDAVNGPAIQDLWMMLSGDRDQRQAQLLEIIEAYEEFFDFDANELTLIEPLRTLRIMHHSAWLAKRWTDPAFPRSFPWFNTERYWAEHILELREQLAALDEPPLRLFPY